MFIRRIRSFILVILWLWPASLYAQSEALMEAFRQGLALYEAGQYEEAEPLFRRALDLGEREFGPDHPTTAVLLSYLALMYHNQGRYEAAEPLYKRALAISDKARWPTVIDYALAHLGGLDVLVNNAGVVLTKPLADTKLEDWRRVFLVNVEGVFLGTRHAMAVMKKNESGSIINVTSTMASVPSETIAAYCASKAAATQFTKVAALNGAANGSRVRVNSIHLGIISTPMIDSEIAVYARERGDTAIDVARRRFGDICPLGMGEPKDIAYGVIYLASDESKYVTGSEMIIDGGHLIAGG
jgi:3(or 17)beta-hydroxysteroid dehydrogenase